ncbi:MAG: hypothetical protein HY708_00045 [Ignavibacteriae bacterium]|nr:hypothetical protein [Ignavibacteriota bacterium]
MPRFDGIKLHAFARETSKYKRTKFIFLSGYKEVYFDALKLDPEIDFLLDKTTSPSEILKSVNELLFGKFVRMWV